MKRIATITLTVATFFVVSHHHALAVPPNTLALGEMQTILALPVGDNPEGIAIDGPNIYFGNRRFVELDGGVVTSRRSLRFAPMGGWISLRHFLIRLSPATECLG